MSETISRNPTFRSALFKRADEHPCFGAFGRSYYTAVFGDTRSDISADYGDVLVLATRGPDIIDYYGFPVQVYVSSSATERQIESAISFASKGNVRMADRDGENSILSNLCRRLGLTPTTKTNAWCDLTGGEVEIHRHLRKSYRSLVNWGRKNLTLTYINADNPDRVGCAEYQDFHKKVAGRSTRPQETWDVMFEWIMSGGGELSLGYLETGELVSGTMVVDGTTTAFYASGVYDRDRFDKPLGHWPLYNSIIRSIDRGMKIYDLGDIPAEDASTKKEFDIGNFKRGFATNLSSVLEWSRAATLYT